MKKMAMVLICVAMMSALVVGAASAATPPWYNCTITAPGATGPFFFVYATSDTTAWVGSQLFLIDASDPIMKAAFAALLTGFANGQQVTLYLPGGIAPNSFISGVSAGLQP